MVPSAQVQRTVYDEEAQLIGGGVPRRAILAAAPLAGLLDRAPDSLRNHYINPMLRDGRLRPRVPGKPNHPGQAYKTNE